jgi:hypothetical protein
LIRVPARFSDQKPAKRVDRSKLLKAFSLGSVGPEAGVDDEPVSIVSVVAGKGG